MCEGIKRFMKKLSETKNKVDRSDETWDGDDLDSCFITLSIPEYQDLIATERDIREIREELRKVWKVMGMVNDTFSMIADYMEIKEDGTTKERSEN